MSWARYPKRGTRERRLRRWHVVKEERDLGVRMVCGLVLNAIVGMERVTERPATGEICTRCASSQ